MDFLYFFTNYKQDYRLEITMKFELLVWLTFEKIIDFSMHNVYWDTLYLYLPIYQGTITHLIALTKALETLI